VWRSGALWVRGGVALLAFVEQGVVLLVVLLLLVFVVQLRLWLLLLQQLGLLHSDTEHCEGG
jgi:hypothetical protein